MPKDVNLIWKHGSSTTFTIKSAYDVAKTLQEHEGTDRTEQSDNTRLKSFWKTVWKLPLSRKIKIFMWKGYHDTLPTGKQKWHIIYKGQKIFGLSPASLI
ncbi:unnamed protein product [Rhodiola kirilowii]